MIGSIIGGEGVELSMARRGWSGQGGTAAAKMGKVGQVWMTE